MPHLYDSFELTGLLQKTRLLLLQSKDVLCRLLQDGSLGKRGRSREGTGVP